MIRFSLRCSNDHGFESWFQSGEAYETLRRAGHVICPDCGVATVEKALMAPQVRKADAAPRREEAIAALRRHIAENSDYVGPDFAAQARAIHAGDAPARTIHGEAKPDEARALLSEGVPILPLPFPNPRKLN